MLHLAHNNRSAFLATTPAVLLTHGGLGSVPVVVVFTKYDRLVSSKRDELKEDDNSLSEDSLRGQSEEEVRKVIDGCVESLKATADTLSKTTAIPTPHYVIVSGIIFPIFPLFI